VFQYHDNRDKLKDYALAPQMLLPGVIWVILDIRQGNQMGHQSEIGFDVGPEVIRQDLAMAPALSTTDITVSIDSSGQRAVAYSHEEQVGSD
jgi:hypothetical protein